MTTTTGAAMCECCGLDVGDVGHFDKGSYPRGRVLCRSCWEDLAVARLFGSDHECSRKGSLDSANLDTNRYVELDETGARSEVAEGWTHAPAQRVLLVPGDDEDDEEEADDDRETA